MVKIPSMNGTEYVSTGAARDGWKDFTNDDGQTINRQTFVDRHNRDQRVRKIAIVTILILIGGCVLAAVICGQKAHALQPQVDASSSQIDLLRNQIMMHGGWSQAPSDLVSQYHQAFSQLNNLEGTQLGYSFAIVGTAFASCALGGIIAALANKMYQTSHCKLEKESREINDITSFLQRHTTIPLHSLIATNSLDAFKAKCPDLSTINGTEEEKQFLLVQN